MGAEGIGCSSDGFWWRQRSEDFWAGGDLRDEKRGSHLPLIPQATAQGCPSQLTYNDLWVCPFLSLLWIVLTGLSLTTGRFSTFWGPNSYKADVPDTIFQGGFAILLVIWGSDPFVFPNRGWEWNAKTKPVRISEFSCLLVWLSIRFILSQSKEVVPYLQLLNQSGLRTPLQFIYSFWELLESRNISVITLRATRATNRTRC